ncbi:unnamed protein product [Caenorhabditis auriculariae]|uniref:Uncharacterized protein n=1 Tax=Caenorhabditis auriculariae TaxID=2777116 RepID=A0A8S1GTQ7_9PELO|nr:unnamed protein product [Caenorhabditis auriculariae]
MPRHVRFASRSRYQGLSGHWETDVLWTFLGDSRDPLRVLRLLKWSLEMPRHVRFASRSRYQGLSGHWETDVLWTFLGDSRDHLRVLRLLKWSLEMPRHVRFATRLRHQGSSSAGGSFYAVSPASECEDSLHNESNARLITDDFTGKGGMRRWKALVLLLAVLDEARISLGDVVEARPPVISTRRRVKKIPSNVPIREWNINHDGETCKRFLHEVGFEPTHPYEYQNAQRPRTRGKLSLESGALDHSAIRADVSAKLSCGRNRARKEKSASASVPALTMEFRDLDPAVFLMIFKLCTAAAVECTVTLRSHGLKRAKS